MVEFQSNLAGNIIKAIQEDRRTRDLTVEVSEQNGLVTLIGRAPSAEFRAFAESIARSQPGVVEVINKLQVLEENERGGEDIETPAPSILAGDKEQSGTTSSLP